MAFSSPGSGAPPPAFLVRGHLVPPEGGFQAVWLIAGLPFQASLGGSGGPGGGSEDCMASLCHETIPPSIRDSPLPVTRHKWNDRSAASSLQVRVPSPEATALGTSALCPRLIVWPRDKRPMCAKFSAHQASWPCSLQTAAFAVTCAVGVDDWVPLLTFAAGRGRLLARHVYIVPDLGVTPAASPVPRELPPGWGELRLEGSTVLLTQGRWVLGSRSGSAGPPLPGALCSASCQGTKPNPVCSPVPAGWPFNFHPTWPFCP